MTAGVAWLEPLGPCLGDKRLIGPARKLAGPQRRSGRPAPPAGSDLDHGRNAPSRRLADRAEATDQERDLVPVQPPRDGQQRLAGSGIGPMHGSSTTATATGPASWKLRGQPAFQQLHACRERVMGADRREAAQDAQRYITRQLVRLRPQHLTCGRRGLARTSRSSAVFPDPAAPSIQTTWALARDRSINAGGDRGKFGVAPDEGTVAHRPGFPAAPHHRPSPKHDSTRGHPLGTRSSPDQQNQIHDGSRRAIRPWCSRPPSHQMTKE